MKATMKDCKAEIWKGMNVLWVRLFCRNLFVDFRIQYEYSTHTTFDLSLCFTSASNVSNDCHPFISQIFCLDHPQKPE